MLVKGELFMSSKVNLVILHNYHANVIVGQELGLKNASRSWKIEDYPDVASQNWYHK